MRLFQNCGLMPRYVKRLDGLAPPEIAFDERRRVFLDDRFGALHLLKPVLDRDADAFLACGNDQAMQRQWAREHGMSGRASLEQILLAQIEHHRTEVFYNLDPMAHPSSFVRKLPRSVRKTLCWRAAPSGNADLSAYGAVLGNFPSILDSWRSKGCRAELFFPAIDPQMEGYGHGDRPIDVLFVGGYSRHHSARAKILEQVAGLSTNWKVVYCLDASRLTVLAESALGRLLPLKKHRRPEAVSKIARPPIFGRDLYDLLGKSKIVLNGAIDMAGNDRGNMRCFEAMGCGALLMSDEGRYPEGMIAEETIVTYKTNDACLERLRGLLSEWNAAQRIASDGRSRISGLYTKERQWASFEMIVANL
jgi:hypothetical protein